MSITTADKSPYRKIPLTQGKVAFVDATDYELVSKYKWCAAKTGRRGDYCAMNSNRGTLRMHTLIMRPPKGMVVDHINHNPLDNRRKNLRICTPQQNRLNSRKQSDNKTGYKGISIQSSGGGRWKYFRVRFMANGKRVDGGLFKDLKEAVKTYKKLAKKYHGEYAYTDG